MNVLILTGRFGMGHYSVASSLAADIRREFDGVHIAVQDIFEYALKDYSDTLYGAYSLIVNRGRRIYGMVYRHTENSRTNVWLPFHGYFFGALDRLFADVRPDAVISTLPVCSRMVSQYKQKYGVKTPLITCITDVSSHSEWIHPYTDIYLVASPSIRRALIRKGVGESSIFVNGIPVKEQFRAVCHNGRPGQRKLLIMGGGLGLLPKKRSFYQKLNRLEGVKTTVITGSNRELFNRLYGRYENIEVVGFTDQVYRYMQQADLIISKPGGITLFETIFSELPILALKPELPQEWKNAVFIQNNRIGQVLSPDRRQWVDAIVDLLYDDQKLVELKRNMRAVKNSIDANAIGKALYSMQRKEVYA